MSETPSKPAVPPDTGIKDAAAPGRFSAETLRKAESELARHIGVMAKVIVKRAAAKARYESELYILIADEIKDPVERRNFIRKAIYASDRR